MFGLRSQFGAELGNEQATDTFAARLVSNVTNLSPESVLCECRHNRQGKKYREMHVAHYRDSSNTRNDYVYSIHNSGLQALASHRM